LIPVANARGKKNDQTCKQSKHGTFFGLVNYDDRLNSSQVVPLLFLERVPMYLGYFFSCGVYYYKEPWQGKEYKYRNHMKRILWFWLFFCFEKIKKNYHIFCLQIKGISFLALFLQGVSQVGLENYNLLS